MFESYSNDICSISNHEAYEKILQSVATFFGKEVSYFSMTPQSLWLELEGAGFGKARFHNRLEPCLQAETWV